MAMGKGMKIAIGCLVALLLACIVAIVVMVFVGKGAWNIFGGVAKDAIAIQKLDETYKFTEPSDGLVQEDRLQAYIAVCARVKPEVVKLQAFTKAHEGGKEGSWSDAKDVMKLTTGLTSAMRKGLEEQKMSPTEFHFVGNAMRMARSTTESAGEGQALDPAQRKVKEEMIANFESLLANPDLPQDQRGEIQGQLDQLRQEIESTPALDPNAALYLKHKQRLDEVDLEGMEGVAFQQGAVSVK